MLKKFTSILVFVCLSISYVASAHQSSHSQIILNQEDNVLKGSWYIAVDDLERSEGLDKNADGQLSWSELRQQQVLIESLARLHLVVRQNNKTCKASFENIMLDNLSSGLYVYLPISFSCMNHIRKLTINYNFLFSFDAQHKAILNIKSAGDVQSIVFSETKRQFKYDALSHQSAETLMSFIGQGVWHIWIGFDHILFLLSLLLPAALILQQGQWQQKKTIKLTVLNAAKIVTAFTLAHSITLALSVFNWLVVPSRFVESVIAASVLIAALNNIKPVVHKRLWLLTFMFGLIHGLGFASVLNDVGLPAGLEGLALFGFNLGVELGQLSIVAVVLPLIYYLSSWSFYRVRMMQLGSLMIASIALIWFIERSTETDIVSWI